MYMSEVNLKSLKICRKRAGFTQKEVEASLSLRALTIKDFESGRLKLPASTAIQLARLYEVDLETLLGLAPLKPEIGQSSLNKLQSLFNSNEFNTIYFDPVLRAHIEDHLEDNFEQTLFQTLTKDESDPSIKSIICEICRMLFSLSSCEGRITPEEISFIRELLANFNLEKKYKELSQSINQIYFPQTQPKGFERIEVRHFTLWILFYFANINNHLNHNEIKYIEKCAEKLKVNKSNYLFIQKHFLQEEY